MSNPTIPSSQTVVRFPLTPASEDRLGRRGVLLDPDF